MSSLLFATLVAYASPWPDLSAPPRVGGGEQDVALVVGIDDYWAVPDVPGAAQNGSDWYRYLVDGRGVPAERVRLLRDGEATVEAMREALAAMAEEQASEGTAWVVFVGHGALDSSGKDQLLLGADVQATASSLRARSLRRSEVEEALPEAVLVLDSCFSGLSSEGAPLVKGLQPLVPTWAIPAAARSTVMAAGRGQQFAGPLRGGGRPAFSYLVLGALHGWGEEDGDGIVTASEAVGYAQRALRATLTGRQQEPVLAGPDRPLVRATHREGPDLGGIVVSGPALLTTPTAPTVVNIGPGRTDDLELERLLAVAMARQEDQSWAGAKYEAWKRVAKHADGGHAYAEQAAAAAASWSEVVDANRARDAAFRAEYGELDDFLATEEISVERRREVVDDFVARWQETQGGRWYYEAVVLAQSAYGAERSFDLPSHGSYGYSSDPGGLGPFFWAWDKSVVRHGGIVPFRLGVPIQTADVAVGVDGQLALGATVGPVDFGLAGVTWLPEQWSINFYGGFQPFTVRRRYRGGYTDPGELGGSWINPIVGVGVRTGQLDASGATWGDVYVANHVFFTNSFGMRFEYRHPVVSLGGDAPIQEVHPVFVPSLVLTPKW